MEKIKVSTQEKDVPDNDTYLEIVLTKENIYKIPVQLLYQLERGWKQFVLKYSLEKTEYSLTTTLEKITTKVLPFTMSRGIKIALKGFPKNVFEKVVLIPRKRDELLDNIFLINNNNVLITDETQDAECFTQDYISKYGELEQEPLLKNIELKEELESEISKVYSQSIKEVCEICLDHFCRDEYYKRVNFSFGHSFDKNNDTNFIDTVSYHIFNYKETDKDTQNLLKKIIKIDEFEDIQEYIKNSHCIQIFLTEKGGDFFKEIWFTCYDFDDTRKEEASQVLGSTFKDEFSSLSVVYKNGEFHESYASHRYLTLKAQDLKEKLSTFSLESKRSCLRFLNSLTKPLNDVSLMVSNDVSGSHIKRIIVSMHHNNFKLYELSSLLEVPLRKYENKDLFELHIEFEQGKKEDIRLFFSPMLQTEEEEAEEEKEIF